VSYTHQRHRAVVEHSEIDVLLCSEIDLMKKSLSFFYYNIGLCVASTQVECTCQNWWS
jgi:hypothetical protein